MALTCCIPDCDLKARVAGSLCHHHAAQLPADKVRMLEVLNEVHERAIGGLREDRIDAMEALQALREEIAGGWIG